MAFRVFVYYCSSAGLYGDVRKKIRHSAAQHCSTARQTTAPHDTARYTTAGKGSPTSIVMRMTMMLSNSIISAIVAFGHKNRQNKKHGRKQVPVRGTKGYPHRSTSTQGNGTAGCGTPSRTTCKQKNHQENIHGIIRTYVHPKTRKRRMNEEGEKKKGKQKKVDLQQYVPDSRTL